MAYRYYHRMAVKTLDIDASSMCDLLDEYSTEEWNYYTNNEGYVFHLDVSYWNETEEMLKEFSTHYPDQVFCVETSGEEWDDRCLVYGKNGQVQRCNMIITFEQPKDFFLTSTESVV